MTAVERRRTSSAPLIGRELGASQSSVRRDDVAIPCARLAGASSGRVQWARPVGASRASVKRASTNETAELSAGPSNQIERLRAALADVARDHGA